MSSLSCRDLNDISIHGCLVEFGVDLGTEKAKLPRLVVVVEN